MIYYSTSTSSIRYGILIVCNIIITLFVGSYNSFRKGGAITRPGKLLYTCTGAISSNTTTHNLFTTINIYKQENVV